MTGHVVATAALVIAVLNWAPYVPELLHDWRARGYHCRRCGVNDHGLVNGAPMNRRELAAYHVIRYHRRLTHAGPSS